MGFGSLLPEGKPQGFGQAASKHIALSPEAQTAQAETKEKKWEFKFTRDDKGFIDTIQVLEVKDQGTEVKSTVTPSASSIADTHPPKI